MGEWFNIFPYHWNWDDDYYDRDVNQSKTTIRIWGWNEKNQGVCVRVTDFLNPIYVELPDTTVTMSNLDSMTIEWNDLKVNSLISHLNSRSKNWYKPVNIIEMSAKPLYDNTFVIDPLTKTLDVVRKRYLKCTFRSQKAIDHFCRNMCDSVQEISNVGWVKLRHYCSKKSLTPVMKFMTVQQIPSSNWIQGKGIIARTKESCKPHEYIVKAENLTAHKNAAKLPIVYPLVCSFDIEAYSTDGMRMPDPEIGTDVVLQVGASFGRKGKIVTRVVFSIGEPIKAPADNPEEDYELFTFTTEKEMLLAWTDYLRKADPDVLIGYNIFGFDIMYLHKRAELHGMQSDYNKFGCIPKIPAQYKTMEWESSARGKIMFHYYDVQGRIFIDVLPMVMASEKLPSYKLEYVAGVHLKTNKDPIKPKDIFRSWKTQDMELFGKVAKYCVVDTVVCYLLWEKLMFWLGLVESATVNKVPIFCMVVQGQQIKAYSQVFDFCYTHDLVCNTRDKLVKQPYRGAIVSEPIAGLYNMILPFDFASLYPSIMIAHNIDFSTFVHLPEEYYETFQWEDHVNCIHDPNYKPTKQRMKDGIPVIATKPKKVVCSSYNYRFVKNDYRRGVIPTIITELLGARKKVRKVIESHEDEIHKLETLNEALDMNAKDFKTNKERMNYLKEVCQVLDKRQLAYKVNANSMYGMYGAENGYLPFFPGAETVTYVGRRSITAANERLEAVHGGKVIYNDTDSAYTYFPKLVNMSVKEIWEFADHVVTDIKTLFREPMKLEFEGKIYPNFLILTKKRYVAQMVDEHGKLKDKLAVRGLPMVRREYAKNMSSMYEKVVRTIFAQIKQITTFDKIADGEQLRQQPEYRGILQMIFDNFVKALSWGCMSDDVTNKYLNFTIFKGLNKESYAGKVAHAVVADKIRARGTPVPQNSRIEFLIQADANMVYDKDKKMSEIVEDLAYFKEWNEILRVDYLQYFQRQYVDNFDILLEVVFGAKKACSNMFQSLVQKNVVCRNIERIFNPTITIDESKADPHVIEQYKLVQSRLKPVVYTTEASLEDVKSSVSFEEEKKGNSVFVSDVPRSTLDAFMNELLVGVKDGWNLTLPEEILDKLYKGYVSQRNVEQIFVPNKEHLFRCFTFFPMNECKVVLLGQDPYPRVVMRKQSDGKMMRVFHAHGLSFSVPAELDVLPPSLDNMFKELQTDCMVKRTNTDLTDWAQQGVLLLNTALTTIADKTKAHSEMWSTWTDMMIRRISSECEDVVFILLGSDAKSKDGLIDRNRGHCVISAGHPSSNNVSVPFFTSKIFSRTNEALDGKNKRPIAW